MSDKVRVLNTFQFGEIEVSDEHVFYFDNGLLGFEDLHEFVLINEEETIPFKWLLSLEEPAIGFPMLSPWYIDMHFDPGKSFDMDKEVFMVVITLENENGFMTANLKAPIIFDVGNQKGRQVILTTDKYSPTHVLKVRN